VLELFPDAGSWSGKPQRSDGTINRDSAWWGKKSTQSKSVVDKTRGSAARFFYCAKASKKDRNEGLDGFEMVVAGGMQGRSDGSMGSVTMNKNHHPTVKPTDLMRYLCRLITPPNGTVLDPFTGSGSTGKAAVVEGFNFIGVEQSEEYIAIAKARIESATK
jgi:site-specific DNA-methyltransferase (adenine-specific)